MCDSYFVEQFIGDRWFASTDKTDIDSAKHYIKCALKESPRSKYRLVKVCNEVIEEFEGDKNAIPPKKVLHCHVCDKLLVKDIDAIYIYHKIEQDGCDFFNRDVICCSEECCEEIIKDDICKLKPGGFEYNDAGWYFDYDD